MHLEPQSGWVWQNRQHRFWSGHASWWFHCGDCDLILSAAIFRVERSA
jgi:hypothetical protein